ncbi:MAG TPA: hypothetical protein VK178_04625 [Opitutaceae bacterium]|nr:hypothetical protein [Opitutaceae bacterium]
MKTVLRTLLLCLAATLSCGSCLADPDTDQALEAFMVKGWPAKKIPADIPEYTGGKIINSGGSQETFYIKVRETSEAELAKYLEVLRQGAWVVNGDSRNPSAEKGLVRLDFNWEGASGLQIAVHQEPEGSWPAAQLPPEIVAPPQARFGGTISVQGNDDEGMWYFTFKCLGMPESAARAWLRELLAKGWSGDEGQLTRSFTWKGRKMSATLEIYETNADSSSFTYNFGVEE